MKSLSALNALLIASFSHLVASVDPHVTLTYTKYMGQPLEAGVSQWLGMRYANPPIRRTRFSPPLDAYDGTNITHPADKHGPRCIPSSLYPVYNKTNQETFAEDCLFLNVFAPTSATTESKLPVFVYIQGGDFDVLSSPNVNGAGLVAASNNSIIVVTFNYRVGPLGFLTGYDVLRFEQPERQYANAGFLDQQDALQWVQRHIATFGGDPNHVVLGGSAASISWHLTANDGEDTGLFHAVAAGSPSWHDVYTAPQLQPQYEHFLRAMGCDWTGRTAEPESICIRLRKSWQEIRAHKYVTPYLPLNSSIGVLSPVHIWGPVVDGTLFKRTPFSAFKEGKFVKVPIIFGDNTDSGAYLAQDSRLEGQNEDWLLAQFPYLDRSNVTAIFDLYEGSELCPSPESCGRRQLERVYGDVANQCPALSVSEAYPTYGIRDSYHYRYNVEDPEDVLGVPPGVEINALFGPSSLPDLPEAAKIKRESYSPGNINSKVVDVMQAYWISFIRTFNPNTYRLPGSAEWATFDSANKQRLRFDSGGKTEMENLQSSQVERCEVVTEKIWSLGLSRP